MTKAGREGGKSLATHLFAILFSFAFISFVVATAIAAYISWTVYEGDAEQRLTAQLEVCAAQIDGMDSEEMVAKLSGVDLANTRITLVASDGSVLYDSEVDAKDMKNHGSRQEIVAAQNIGESVVQRKSETTGSDSLYAAVRVGQDDSVLRLAETRTSLMFYLGGLLVPLVLAILAAALLSALMARTITRYVTAPLLDVNLDEPLNCETYKEVRPLLGRMDAQRAELKEQNLRLTQAVTLRREFTGNVSHEMKSPLQVIGGYAELIESGITSPEDTKKFAGIIRSESQTMRELIDDVLTLSRLDEGVSQDPTPFDIAAVISLVVQRLELTAESKGVALQVACEHGVKALGFELQAEQAVYNLVDNAIRYGNARVEIRTDLEGDWVRVFVSDDGPGIPADQRERIFERFYRLDPSRSRSTGGTGLGLAIVKHAAEDMGGSVRVQDASIGGAEFVMELPAQHDAARS